MDPRFRLLLLVIFLGLLLPPAVASGEPARTIDYIIRPGDTLSAIGRAHGLTVAAIAEANGIRDPDRIVAGRTIVLPMAAPPPTPPPAAAADGEGRLPSRWHRVVGGDTLTGLARTYGLTLDTLRAVNGLEGDGLRRGEQLSLTPVPPPPAGAGRSHTVARGDTLAGIAAAWGTTVADLAARNGLADPDLIVIGQQLTLPGWLCPVDGPLIYVDDFGYTKPSGRVHEGIDIHALAGTPVVAPVGGVVEQVEGDLGGLQSWLVGDDGVTYIASHLEQFRAPSGRVAAGTVLGTVGTTGNAARTEAHVHFEMHPSKAGPVNPRAHLDAAC